MSNQDDYSKASGNRELFPENNGDNKPSWNPVIIAIILMAIFGLIFLVILPWIFSLFGG